MEMFHFPLILLFFCGNMRLLSNSINVTGMRTTMNNILLTVITPTFNRSHTLSKCYESLCQQTDQRFQWMVIDDGSTDKTEELFEKWIHEGQINILYYKKENGGKASALNYSFSKIYTPYAVCLDSDDYFSNDAVFKAISQLERICNDKLACGIVALRNNLDGSVMGDRTIPNSFYSVTAADLFLRLNLNTELICFYKTDILKNYSFPIFEGEKFVSPAWMQYTITQDYYYVVSRDCYCYCEYISDGLTKNKQSIIKNNPNGYSCVKKFSFNLSPSMLLRIKHGIMYDYGCLLSHNSNWLDGVDHKLLALLLMPLAYFVKLLRL